MADEIKWSFEGWDDAIAEIKRLTGEADFRIVAGFEGVFAQVAESVDAKVHVLTGSLRASGKRSTEYNAAQSRWTGELSYGGTLVKSAVPGPPIDPVVYAVYERNRGGSHDFFGEVHLWEPEYEAVILGWMSGAGPT